jgi:hypothetical protein
LPKFGEPVFQRTRISAENNRPSTMLNGNSTKSSLLLRALCALLAPIVALTLVAVSPLHAAPWQSVSSAAPQATPSSSPAGAQQSATPKTGGMVWVNTDTGVYHKPGSHWYGKTKHGKYMLEADAVKAGYKPAKPKR